VLIASRGRATSISFFGEMTVITIPSFVAGLCEACRVLSRWLQSSVKLMSEAGD
jgi:hypothetical protein